jgi:hypothetical protein
VDHEAILLRALRQETTLEVIEARGHVVQCMTCQVLLDRLRARVTELRRVEA